MTYRSDIITVITNVIAVCDVYFDQLDFLQESSIIMIIINNQMDAASFVLLKRDRLHSGLIALDTPLLWSLGGGSSRNRNSYCLIIYSQSNNKVMTVIESYRCYF